MVEWEGSDRLRRSPSLEQIDCPPALYRPPLRSLASPRLSTEECDELTNPNLPYNTRYTYAYSKSYRTDTAEAYEVPNMTTHHYLTGRITNSSSVTRTASNAVTSIRLAVTRVTRLILSTFGSIGSAFIAVFILILRSVLVVAESFWCFLVAIYNTLVDYGFGPIFNFIYLVLDSVGRHSYNFFYYIVNSHIYFLSYPFTAIYSFLTTPRVKSVTYSDDNSVRYYRRAEAIQQAPREEEEDGEEGGHRSLFSYLKRWWKGGRTHMEPIYELRSRTIQKEVADETDTDMEDDFLLRMQADTSAGPMSSTPIDATKSYQAVQQAVQQRKLRKGSPRRKTISILQYISDGVSWVWGRVKHTLELILSLILFIIYLPFLVVQHLFAPIAYLFREKRLPFALSRGSNGNSRPIIIKSVHANGPQHLTQVTYTGHEESDSDEDDLPLSSIATTSTQGTRLRRNVQTRTTHSSNDNDHNFSTYGSFQEGDDSGDETFERLTYNREYAEPDGRRKRTVSRSVTTVTRNGTGGTHSSSRRIVQSKPLLPALSSAFSSGGRVVRDGITGTLRGGASVLSTLLDVGVAQPVRGAGYVLQNGANYALSPLYYLRSALSSSNVENNNTLHAMSTRRRRAREGSSSSRGSDDIVSTKSYTSTLYAPVGGVAWAVKESTAYTAYTIRDWLYLFFFTLFDWIRTIGEYLLGGIYFVYDALTRTGGFLGSGASDGLRSVLRVLGSALSMALYAVYALFSTIFSYVEYGVVTTASKIATLYHGKPVKVSFLNALKWLLFFLLLFLILFWLIGGRREKNEPGVVDEVYRRATVAYGDFYNSGYYEHSRSRIGAFFYGVGKAVYGALAWFLDLFRMFFQLILLGIYGIYSSCMDGLAVLQVDRWFSRGDAPIPPPIVHFDASSACQVQCPPPPQPAPVYIPAPPVETNYDTIIPLVVAQVLSQIKIPSPPPAVQLPPPTLSQEQQDALTAAILAKVLPHLNARLDDGLQGHASVIEESVRKAQTELAASITSQSSSHTTVTHEPIDYAALAAMIKAAIVKYDSDKTGRPDYALETAGGQIISTRCSETYPLATRVEKIFNIPLFYSNYGPRVVIQRNSQGLVPGECWAFKGAVGYLTLKLSHPLRVTAVSYEHIQPSLSPNGENKSAPNKFTIFSYKNDEYDFESRAHLGTFEYDNKSEPLQEFTVTARPPYPVQIIELQVDSNHGEVYTCLYRFRVHGDIVRS